MYIIFDKTEKKAIKHNGDWPEILIERLIQEGHEIEVFSSYSNSLKYNFKLIWNTGIISDVENEEIKLKY